MTDTFIAHCENVYRALADRATINVETQELVFTGQVVEIYKSLNISQAYYGPIFQTLEDVGSILRLQRGARGIDTVMVLRGLPDVWPEGLGWKGNSSKPLTEDSRYGKILHEVQEMQQGNVGGINILTALAEQEQRIIALESKVLHLAASEDNGKAKK